METASSPQLRQDMLRTSSYAQHLDKQAIPAFLVHLPNGQVSKQYAIQQYEAIAREHGKTIIPHIGEIMNNVLKVLSSDGPSLASLQEACAKVVSALARYTIDPSSFQGQREEVLRNLSTPLLEVLLGNLQTMAEGAAVCLQSLVETETWKFAPQDIVNDVCLRVTGALEEKGTQTVSHMKLVGALIKHNGLILEAYGRSLLKAATQIVNSEVWQLRLHAVQMINTLLRTVDADILASEIPNAIISLERCRSDRMPSIRKSAAETLRFARAMASDRSTEVPYDDGCSEVEGLYQNMTSPDLGYYVNSPVSSLRSTSSRYPTPSVVRSVARDPESYSLNASRGYYSDSMDEGCWSRRRRDSTFSILSQLSNSTTPNNCTDIISEHTPQSQLNNMGKDRGPRVCVVGRSQFFDKEGYRRRHSLGTGITFDNDAHKVVESDQRVYQRRFSLGHAERLKHTRSSMLEQIEKEVDRKDYFERKHSYKKNGESENTSFSFHINGHQSPCPSDVDEEETEKLVKAECLMRTDDMKASSTRRTLVRFANHSTPSGTIRKRHPNTEYAELADGYYDVLHEGNSEGIAVAPKGRAPFDSLESVADGYSDRSNSQEGSMHNSPVWSESVERSDSLSRTSSGTPFQDTPDNEEAYLTTLSTEPDGTSHKFDEMMEGCQQAEDDYVEGSFDSFELEETSAFRRGWAKLSNFMESILGVSLCVVLAIPATMVAVKLLTIQEEYHAMVPT